MEIRKLNIDMLHIVEVIVTEDVYINSLFNIPVKHPFFTFKLY